MEDQKIIYRWADATAAMKKLCEPLQAYGIDHFSMIRSYDEGHFINLSNIDNWIEYYYREKLYLSSCFENHPSSYFSCVYLWGNDLDGNVVTSAKQVFNSYHGMTVIDRKFKYTNFYFFSTRLEYHHISHFYANYIEHLYKFIYHFEVTAKSLIADHILPSRSSLYEEPYIANSLPGFEKLAALMPLYEKRRLLSELSPRHQAVSTPDLTLKESECLTWVLKGLSSKEIAEKLHNSARTVEFHLNNLKDKFGCKTVLALISKVYCEYHELAFFLLKINSL